VYIRERHEEASMISDKYRPGRHVSGMTCSTFAGLLVFGACVPLVSAQEVRLSSCLPAIALGYDQRNNVAKVDGTIDTAQCAATSGDIELTVSIRDAAGALQTLKFTQHWQREGDPSIVFEAEYPIGENVDLVRVRARGSRCACAEIPEE
jgi:hypothetical protein